MEHTEKRAGRQSVDDNGCASSRQVGVLSRQYSSSEGGMQTDMDCPNCVNEINGSYLPVFRCPDCDAQIWRDENGEITSFENKFACPECGRGSAMESAKQALVTSLVSGFRALLIYSLQVAPKGKTKSADCTYEFGSIVDAALKASEKTVTASITSVKYYAILECQP